MGHKKIKCQTDADVSRAVRAKERAEKKKRKRSEAANVLLEISQELSNKGKKLFLFLEIYNLCMFDYLACVSIELHIL